jgi:hypothetical protein
MIFISDPKVLALFPPLVHTTPAAYVKPPRACFRWLNPTKRAVCVHCEGMVSGVSFIYPATDEAAHVRCVSFASWFSMNKVLAMRALSK